VAGVIYWALSFRSIPKEVSGAEAIAAPEAARTAG
jgi:hypothetical protein